MNILAAGSILHFSMHTHTPGLTLVYLCKYTHTYLAQPYIHILDSHICTHGQTSTLSHTNTYTFLRTYTQSYNILACIHSTFVARVTRKIHGASRNQEVALITLVSWPFMSPFNIYLSKQREACNWEEQISTTHCQDATTIEESFKMQLQHAWSGKFGIHAACWTKPRLFHNCNVSWIGIKDFKSDVNIHLFVAKT